MANWTTSIDWTSAATIKGNWNLWLILDDLASAVNERASAAGVATISYKQGCSRKILNDIDDKFDAVFGYFVNHLDSSGDWTGDSDPPPFWTVADLETQIGTSRPRMQLGEKIDEDWIWWMYKALNLLLWTGAAISYSGGTYDWKYDWDEPSWSTCVSDFNAASWSGLYNSRIGHISALRSGWGYMIQRFAKTLTRNPNAMARDYQFYSKFATGTAIYAYGSNYIYENNDYTAPLVSTWYPIISGSAAAAAGISEDVGKISTNSCSQPASAGDCRGWQIEASFWVEKWNVTNGFQKVA